MTEQKIKVKKRDGHFEPLDIAKIHRVVEWAAEGLDVSSSQVEINSHIQFYNGISTTDIHETLVKSAADLISTEYPDYQHMAARLALFHIRKIAYDDYTPPHLFDHVKKMCELGWYDKEIITYYSKEEFDELNDYIVHDRDLSFAYAGIKQMEAKYLVQNRLDKKPLESPQVAFMLIGACIFSGYPKETRMDYVKKFYDSLSKFRISLPTPVMAGVRTPTRQYSSCVTIESGDSLDSINASTSAIVKYISQRAGIGINGGRIRALGSEIRGGEVVHTGVIPFWKMFQAAVKSCSQGAIRGGAATLYYPIWHLEVESLIVLKNNRGVEDNRIRQLDYGVQLNKLMYTRLINDEDITLFSPHSVEGMYDAFFNDQKLFEKLYTEAENNPLIPKKKIPARDLFSLLMSERANTGRIYIMNVDHCNTHSSFDELVAPIHMSNLCVAGNTKVLTKEGEVTIGENVGKKFTVWNGYEWSENVEFVQTGENVDLYHVTLEDGRYLDCTDYHKWLVGTTEEDKKLIPTIELKVGTPVYNPDTSKRSMVSSITRLEGKHNTYCFTEPKRHLGVFNGILTGQCTEITLPTKPLNNINDEEGLISLCTLSGINLGKIEKLEDLEEGCDLLVRSLDELLSYQNYPIPAAKRATELYRSLGIGVINFAYYLTKNGKRIKDGSGLELTHQTFEALQYYLLKSSVQLAKEKGTCLGFKDTKYARGILPIDTYKKDIDAFAPFDLKYDWESLREEIQEFGLRNATLSTQFPSESSSQVSNATNGIDIPRSPLTIKASKDGILKQIVPEYEKLKDQYEYLWDDNNNQGFLKIVAIIQKFMDQAISTNTRYNPAMMPNGKVPMKLMLQELLLAYKWGVKTLYYHHTNDGSNDTHDDLNDGCAGGACKL
jgi:ribonucleoside-diphosphate reductase, alpha subunit